MRERLATLRKFRPIDNASSIAMNVYLLSFLGIYALITVGGESLVYILITIIILFARYRQIETGKTKADDLQYQRSEWLFDVLNNTIGKERTIGDSMYLARMSKLKRYKKYYQRELGIEDRDHIKQRVSPDFREAETSIIKLEERVSILLGSIMFIPILFALVHMFRNVELILFLIELHAVILLNTMVIQSQLPKYEIQGWKEVFFLVQDKVDEIAQEGRKTTPYFSNLYEYPVLLELGSVPVSMSQIPATRSFAQILEVVYSLPRNKRKTVLENVLNELKSLPVKEQLLLDRFQAYSLRFRIITLVTAAVSGLLVGIASFSVSQLSSSLIPIESTPFLFWGQLILVTTIFYQISRSWEQNQPPIYNLITATIVFVVFYLFSVSLSI